MNIAKLKNELNCKENDKKKDDKLSAQLAYQQKIRLEYNRWFQYSLVPSFFGRNKFTSEDGSLCDNQKDNFKLVQTLLTTGNGEDNNKQLWQIPDF